MDTSRRPPSINEHTWAQASEWLLRFSEEEVDAVARQQFNDWLRMSPENVQAYLQVSAFWQSADQLGRNEDGSRDIDALVARARSAGNVLPLADFNFAKTQPPVTTPAASANTPTRNRINRSNRRFTLAASLFLGMVALGTHYYLQRGVYQTDIGEQRIVNLPDGSTLTLNADSRVTVRYSGTARTIDLNEGQALFKVAKDAQRPFLVRSGGTSVRAVGTQFDVYKKMSGTVVTVVEGRVAVSSTALEKAGDAIASSPTLAERKTENLLVSAGEQLTVAPSIAIAAVPAPVIRPIKLETATAWTEGLLVFESAPLAEVVQEFNRQNAKPLVLEGRGLEAVRITGVFPANGSERITRFLQERHGVVVDETDTGIRISRP